MQHASPIAISVHQLKVATLFLTITLAAACTAQFKLAAWGSNEFGESNVPPGPFIDMAAGTHHNVAIKPDGTLVSWGRDTRGAVSQTPLGAYRDVSAGGWFSIAIDMNGHLVGWGDQSAPVPAGVYTEVVSGTYHSIAFRSDRTIVGWGSLGPDVPPGAFDKVSVGPYHCVGLRPNGTVECWGANTQGQANNPSGQFIDVTAGAVHSVGIRSDGTLEAWGWNAYGQLEVPEGQFKAIAAGAHHTVALRTNGTLVAWGYNAQGQIDCPPGTYSKVYAGWFHSVAARECLWTAVSLHPPGANYSAAFAAGDGQIAGLSDYGAALWTGLEFSTYLDLRPAGVDGSEIWDVANGVQIGSGSNFDQGWNSAGIWTGDKNSWRLLPPGNQTFGTGAGTDGIYHVGATQGAIGNSEAALWSGVFPFTRISLHPASASSSFAWGIANGVQVGSISWPTGSGDQTRATVWYGSGGSMVDIHPAGSDRSEAYRTDGVQHVGSVFMGSERAALWISNFLWTDLTPAGYNAAGAYNLGFGHQVGYTYLNGYARAAIWSGTAESFEDLHNCLPVEFANGYSYAWDIDVRDGKLVVVGEAYNTVTGQTEAVIWIKDLPNQPPVVVLQDGGAIETGNPTPTTAFITLDGRGSYDPDGDELTYIWTSDPEWLIPNGDAPLQIVQVSPGTYSFTLTVTDPSGASDSKTVTYTVVQANRPPVANAGPDQTVTVPHDGSPEPRHCWVELNGGASSDPDGDSLQYLWSGPSGLPLQGQFGQNAIEELEPGNHTFTLRVTDPGGQWSEDTVTVTVLPEPNQSPIVDAGPDIVLTAPKGVSSIFIQQWVSAADPDGDPLITDFLSGGIFPGRWVVKWLSLGTSTFSFSASDPYGAVGSDSFFASLLPHPGGNPGGPKAKQDRVDVWPGTAEQVDALSNDSHTEGQPIYFLGMGSGSYVGGGVIGGTHLGSGMVHVYVSPTVGKGNYDLTYYIRDDQGRTDVGTIRVKVK